MNQKDNTSNTGNSLPSFPPVEVKDMNENEYFSFVIKRTERLSAALYLVTNFIADTEPLKWKLRERTLELLSDISLAHTRPLSERYALLLTTTDTICELIALLEIALAGRLISEMNAAILKNEYARLQRLIEEKGKIKTESEEYVFKLFEDQEPEKVPSVEQNKNNTNISKGHKGQEKKDSVFYNKDKKTQEKREKNVANHQSNEERRKQIILLIKQVRVASIKDISSVMTDCSEKTIQRELSAMVKDNILKKEGEKRWSRYSLISQ